jgi:glycosyltransferase involved in cell wall biosynthesis
MNRLISFIIPTRDEEASIGELTDRICESMEDNCNGLDFEILFVDDGSSDTSWSVMESLAQVFPGVVRAIRFRRNIG